MHFSGPRLIGYEQLPLSPIVVMPTKVSLQNRHPLSSLSTYCNTEQDADQEKSIQQVTPDLDPELYLTEVYIGSSVINSYQSSMVTGSSLLQFIINDVVGDCLTLEARSRYPLQVADLTLHSAT